MKINEGTGTEQLCENQSGTVKITPEEPDDLWLLYTLLSPGDIVTSQTTIKVQHNHSEDKAKNKAVRVLHTLDLKITDVDYQKDSSILRVKGRTVGTDEKHGPQIQDVKNPVVRHKKGSPVKVKNMATDKSEYQIPSGSFQTIEIDINKQFELKKKIWESDDIDALREGCSRKSGADLIVLVMHSQGAIFYAVGKSATNQCAQVVKNPKSNTDVFLKNVFDVFTKQVDFGLVRTVLIGGNDSTKDEFRQYLLSESTKSHLKSILNNKSHIVVVNTKGKNDLEAILSDVDVMKMIKDTNAFAEIKAFQELSYTLRVDCDRACYGSKSVETAQEMMAIEMLLITDELFKSAEIETRNKYIELVKAVKKAGGVVYAFSSTHVCTEKLAQLTGIAAILRFPIPDIDELQLS